MRFRRAHLIPLGLALACQSEPTTPSSLPFSPGRPAALVGADVVASVRLAPDSQLVFVNDQLQVTAQARNTGGELLERTFRWTVANTAVATPLTLGSTSAFQAIKIAKTTLRAAVDGKSGTSKLIVRTVAGGKVIVTPATVDVGAGGTVQFLAVGRTKQGETAAVNVTWTATGGTVSSSGLLAAPGTAGTYQVIATSRFGAADTAVVTVAPPPDPLGAVVLLPESATLEAGGRLRFEAYGVDLAGDSVAAEITYTAGGGTIAADGEYVAGNVAGEYTVVATGPGGAADTAAVTVTPAPIGRVLLLPDVAASRSGVTTRFAATVLNTVGEVVAEPVTYAATCGAVTETGVYTAPGPGDPSCLVTATAGEQADTTEVLLLTGQGMPFGLSDLWATNTSTVASGVALFTASHDNVFPGELIAHITAARARGIRLVLNLTGGSHDRYKTGGVFDEAKWRAAMDAFNTQANRDAVAQAVLDGTIIGNSVMDEPQQAGTSAKAWGPDGTLTKARVDGLCAYVRGIFPTLPVGVFHDPYIFQPDSTYQVCEFLIAQYATRKGNVVAWRDAALALVQRDEMRIIFSLNLLDGGQQDKSGTYDCAGTGGLGTYSPNCRMTPDQVRTYGLALGPAGCGLLSWKYDAAFMGKPENQAALSAVAVSLANVPPVRCGRE